MSRSSQTHDIPTHVKSPQLVKTRRRQIINAAVELFIKNGFHKTTTREIAHAAGLSIGSLYEYIASKEDILYLVCDAIHADVERLVTRILKQSGGGKRALEDILREYFLVCHRMSDFILLIYQETRALPEQWQKKVLENELRITGLFVAALTQLRDHSVLSGMDDRTVELAAHNISVMGHMWTFRRWFFNRHYDIEEYIERQTAFLLNTFNPTPPVIKRPHD